MVTKFVRTTNVFTKKKRMTDRQTALVTKVKAYKNSTHSILHLRFLPTRYSIFKMSFKDKDFPVSFLIFSLITILANRLSTWLLIK